MNEQANAYLRARVMSARPEQLRMMLLEGALKFARMGGEGLRGRNFEQAYLGIHQCQDILMELITALRPEIAPELCNRLAALYTYLYRRLIDAHLERNAALVDEVIGLLEYERETWGMLLEKLEAEREGRTLPDDDSQQVQHTAPDPTARLGSLANLVG